MWKSKKFIVAVVLAVILVIGTVSGIALAADNGDNSDTTATVTTLWDNMATVLQEGGVSVTADQLQSAFEQVREDQRNNAIQNYLDKLVEDGTISQEQADAYKAWIEAMPDMGGALGIPGNGGMLHQRIQMRGFGGMHGFGGFGGFGGNCLPAEPTQ